MPDEVKTCRFYHFIKCGETNCCNCPNHPLQNTGHDFMAASERDKLAERRMIMDEVKNYPPYLDYPKPYKPQTNADRIRAMSDKELARFLASVENRRSAAGGGAQWCGMAHALKWLQQPAEGE